MKTESCHEDNLVVIDGMESCHYDNFQCYPDDKDGIMTILGFQCSAPIPQVTVTSEKRWESSLVIIGCYCHENFLPLSKKPPGSCPLNLSRS